MNYFRLYSLNHHLFDRQYIVYNRYIASELYVFFPLIYLSIVSMRDVLGDVKAVKQIIVEERSLLPELPQSAQLIIFSGIP